MQPFDRDEDRLDSPTPQSIHRRTRWSITNLTVEIPSSRPTSASVTSAAAPVTGVSSTPRWNTREFYAYYVIFLLVVPQMISAAVKVSSSKHSLYYTYQHQLDQGWLGRWKVDNSDHQYHLFRSHLPLLALLFTLYLSLSHLFRARWWSNRLASRQQRSRFILAFSLIMLSVLHGASLIKMLIILAINWRLARTVFEDYDRSNRRIRKEWIPWITWSFNVIVLFANEIYGGYEFGSIVRPLSWLDDYKGILPRWHIMWNISMLRIISFNMESFWSVRKEETKPASTKYLPPPPLVDPQGGGDNYSFELFLSYVFYPPLYLAGPIITYPSFLSQLSPCPPSAPPPSTPPPTTSSVMDDGDVDETSFSAILRYFFRFLSSLFTMELVLHTMYVVAIKDSGIDWWENLTPLQVSMVGFWNLIIVWLKLLIPWRFFRLVSLIDGIDPPENMVRCMANNYSTLGFWRSWHRSYNLWIIRYLYVPLGGSKRPIIATVVVFTFVALWHDLSMKLLAWGWIVSLFVLPEMVANSLVPYKTYGHQWWYRHLAALGGVFNVLLMMTANLVGFVVGTDGAKALWYKMLGTNEGRVFMAVASACLFVAIQVMFEYREAERRRGINRRC